MRPLLFKPPAPLLFALLVCACSTTVDRDQPNLTDKQTNEYVTWMRVAGLYPLTRVPVASGFERWKEEYRAEVNSWTGKGVVTWSVGSESADAPEIVRQHAPVFLIETESHADDIGYPEPSQDGKRVHIDAGSPVVLWRQSTTEFKGETHEQISYILWFSERPKKHALDLLGGSLDSVIFRVTIGADGSPILYDTIHGCGCYHLFFPVTPLKRKPMPEDEDLREAAFVPFEAPNLAEGERLGVRISAGDHYVIGFEAAPAVGGKNYELVDAREAIQEIAHLYDRNGILPQSRRLERFILWPMGIRSAGAMRAWGHHATAFVGKRHFDDADLLDRAFE